MTAPVEQHDHRYTAGGSDLPAPAHLLVADQAVAAARRGVIAGENDDRATINSGGPRHQPVRRNQLTVRTGLRRSGERPELMEAVRVGQLRDALARRLLAPSVLPCDGLRAGVVLDARERGVELGGLVGRTRT